MIEKMRKYTFMLHHAEYLSFLSDLQNLGMVHVVINTNTKSDRLIQTHLAMEEYSNALKKMQKYISDNPAKSIPDILPSVLLQKIHDTHIDKERLLVQHSVLAKEISELEPWGDFDHKQLKELENNGLKLDLFQSSSHLFNLEWINLYALKKMQKHISDIPVKSVPEILPSALLQKIHDTHIDKERLLVQHSVLAKEISELEPWGDFDHKQLKELENSGLKLDLFQCSSHLFNLEWINLYPLKIIRDTGTIINFAVLHKIDEPVLIDAEMFKLPPRTLSELKKQEIEIGNSLSSIDQFYRDNANAASELFTAELDRLTHDFEFEKANLQSYPEADNQIRVLQGWIPNRLEGELLQYLDNNSVLYFAVDGKVEDNPPILLKNNWFARTFEPISNMFMLPYYNELDLTPFLAPFYMMFFGFSSGDSGYGIVLFILGWLLKKKVKGAQARSFLTLIQMLGVGTIIMGFVMGSFFSFDIKKIAFLNPYVPIRDTNQIFNFALLLGVIQILTGKILNAIKQMMQGGFIYGVAPIGMVIFTLSLAITGSTMLGAKPGVLLKYTPYGMYLGLAMIFLINSPGRSIIFNVANGIWVMYGLITAFFGDLLSYIRLFALGVSGGILGFVINTMAAQFGTIPIVGPVLFILFMVLGHGLNIALSSLGAFVHPMRLTFVEFFNNSGFSGPGIPYKPFGKQSQLIK